MRVVIVSHTWTHGVQHELRDYLNRRGEERVVLICHPLPEARGTLPSSCEIYRGGRLLERREVPRRGSPGMLSCLRDPLLTLSFIARAGAPFDVYVGADSLNAMTGLFLKRLRRVKKVIYYSHSLQERRFDNRLANSLYHFLDGVCIRRSDFIWNLSMRLTEHRRLQGVAPGRNVWAPVGVNFDRIRRLPIEQIDSRRLVFSGLLTKKNGIKLVLEALPAILGEVPGATLTIIGDGELAPVLKEEVRKNNLGGAVKFTGLMDHDELMKFLPGCGIGIATYMPLSNSMVRSTDPTKLKEYMACGLPVIMTDVPETAAEIRQQEAGLVIGYNPREFEEAAIGLMKNRGRYLRFRENSIRFAERYRWGDIFRRALGCLSKACE